MSYIPPSNYFMKQEEARAATKKFGLILQEAFEEYKKIWDMYINLVKKCEGNKSRSFSKDKSDARQKGRNYKCTENISTNDQDITNSVASMEDVLAQCTLDLISNIQESDDNNRSEKIKEDAVPGSPIFQRNNCNVEINTFRKSNHINVSSRNINDNSSDDNEQENIDKACSVINANSTVNIPSVFLCSTPKRSPEWSKSKKRNVKRGVQSKSTMPSSSLKKKNNLIGTRKEKIKNAPLQIINNTASIPTSVRQVYENSNKKSYNIQVTMSPSSRKLKQTKLVFHKTKRTMELSNNLKSLDVTQTIKTNNLISSEDKIIEQNTLIHSTNLKEKGSNDKRIGNTYNRIEVSKDVANNHFVLTGANTQIKNEVILQEYEQINWPEINAPLNTSNESDSTFFEENECHACPNENNSVSLDSDKTYESLMKNEMPSTNGNFEQRHATLTEMELNIAEINDIEEPIGTRKLFKLEKGKNHCNHHRSTRYSVRSLPTSSRTLLPDSPSSTT